MKKLTVVCKDKVITEFQASSEAASLRLVEICKKNEVISSEIQDAVRHIEVLETKERTLTNYSKIK